MNYIERAQIAQTFLTEHRDPDVVTVSLYGYKNAIDLQTSEAIPGIEYEIRETDTGVSHSARIVRDGIPLLLSYFVRTTQGAAA